MRALGQAFVDFPKCLYDYCRPVLEPGLRVTGHRVVEGNY